MAKMKATRGNLQVAFVRSCGAGVATCLRFDYPKSTISLRAVIVKRPLVINIVDVLNGLQFIRRPILTKRRLIQRRA